MATEFRVYVAMIVPHVAGEASKEPLVAGEASTAPPVAGRQSALRWA